MRSSTSVALIPPACVQTRAPRCVEGHKGDSKVASGRGTSSFTSVLMILTGPTARIGMVANWSASPLYIVRLRIFYLKSMSRKAIKGHHSTGKSTMTATEYHSPEYVILVDEEDKEIGLAEKLLAHQKNLLHRAFSVFIFRKTPQLELLLQQRALHKYHSPGLWTNTCCSHPRSQESVIAAGERRLQEELGFMTTLNNLGCFHYNAHFSNGLSENEIDHVLIGTVPADIVIKPNKDEIHAYRWMTLNDLQQALKMHPEAFTPWLEKALDIVLKMAAAI